MSESIRQTGNLTSFEEGFDGLLNSPVYSLSQLEKERLLQPHFLRLHEYHSTHCQAYWDVSQLFKWGVSGSLSDYPYLAVRLFKLFELKSIEKRLIYKTLQSSGTTDQIPARILLDRQSSARQSKVLVKIMQHWLGKQRLPMLIIDSPTVLKNKALYSARGAGIQGLSFLGRDHTYALDDKMQLNMSALSAFEQKYHNHPVLIFGFTFMVWRHFLQALQTCGKAVRLPHGTLLHSGGWKKLESEKVDNKHFKQLVKILTSIERVHNFYGMAEQVGSVFVECEQGHLHAPVFADLIVRNHRDLKPCEIGEQGLLQVLSVLPTSYPGQSLLTEDVGTLLGIDDCPCGRLGKYFNVLGRVPKAEVRGCSDTFS